MAILTGNAKDVPLLVLEMIEVLDDALGGVTVEVGRVETPIESGWFARSRDSPRWSFHVSDEAVRGSRVGLSSDFA